MQIEIAEPPMIEEIIKAFPNRPKGVIYAFGNTIYNPSGAYLHPALVEHEGEHGRRQLAMGPGKHAVTQWSGPELWWRQYIEDVEFRFNEELRAHAIEYLSLETGDRNQRARLLTSTVERLLAPFYEYGDLITRGQATVLLRKAIGDVPRL